MNGSSNPPPMSISNLLKSLRPTNVTAPDATPQEIALAISSIFTNQLSPVQIALLLYNLSLTGLEQQPDVLAQCANAMRAAAVPVDITQLKDVIEERRIRIGGYKGGLCDIVGTGGDYHSTFNISTASSIVASSLLRIAKHGNRASTSKSGSSEVLSNLSTPAHPNLEVVDSAALLRIYKETNYAFLFAPNFHKGMKYAAAVRKEMPNPTIFNLLGPLSNPAEAAIEARMIGVKKRDLVDVFAEALKQNGAKKAMVVCGDEDLDEISCAGPTHCARITPSSNDREGGSDVKVERFMLSPKDFGLPEHPLSTVSPGLTPQENAKILLRLISNDLPAEDPILHFVLINTAALFVVSGVCDSETSAFGDDAEVLTEVGPGGGRWKEGVRLARLAISSGKALDMVRKFADITTALSKI